MCTTHFYLILTVHVNFCTNMHIVCVHMVFLTVLNCAKIHQKRET